MAGSLHMVLFDLAGWGPVLLLSTALPLFLFIIKYYIERKRGLPLNWPIIGIIPSIVTNQQHIYDYLTTLLKISRGSMVITLGKEFLLTSDPANVNHIANLHFKNYPKGDDDESEISDIFGNGILNADGESWKTQRKMALAALSGQQFHSFVARISQEKVDKGLIPLLNQTCEMGMALDLQDVLLRFTFDATCSLILGVDPGSLASDFPAIPFSKATDQFEEVIFNRHLVPMFWWKLMRRLDVGQEKKMRMAREVIDQFTAKIIKERREYGDDQQHTGMLRSYMDNHVQRGEGYYSSDEFLRDTLVSFLSAGKTTTGVTLSWFFWLVSKNPNVEAKILDELRENTFNNGETTNLVYLQASLCESLRLYPPLALVIRHSLGPDVLPSGHKVYSGMGILISVYSMGRMEGIWGDDCLEFRPERWLTVERKLRLETSYKFSAFGSGPRICLGKGIAFSQMKILAAAVIRNFHIEPVEGHVVEPKLSIVMNMKNGLMVKVTKRDDVE